jgi:type I restriction enzyme, S subunit
VPGAPAWTDREDMTRETSESPLLPARHRFKPYPAYQDSGVEWLGQIPAHWDVQRTKHVARLRSGHTPSRQHPEYWVHCTIPWFGLADVWQLRDGCQEYVAETNEKISALGLANSAARLLPKGTVILSRTASVGFSGIMATEMATTQDFVNWVCDKSIRPEYLLYVFRSMTHEFRRLTMGSTHQTIYMPDVGTFSTPVPPILEQDGIVAFIRRETARIDGLVAKKERLIELLLEKRAAFITRAVTKGLDPNAPMRDSGVEWLGELPAHWEVVQLGQAMQQVMDFRGRTPLKLGMQWGGDIPAMSAINVRDGHIDLSRGVNYGSEDLYDRWMTLGPTQKGDIVYTTEAPLGNAAVVPDDGRYILSQRVVLLRANSRQLHTAYLLLVLRSSAFLQGVESQATGSTAEGIKRKHLLAMPVWLPPLEEQSRIVALLHGQLNGIGGLLSGIQRAISLLLEYRTALISAAVTGKIDVRAA